MSLPPWDEIREVERLVERVHRATPALPDVAVGFEAEPVHHRVGEQRVIGRLGDTAHEPEEVGGLLLRLALPQVRPAGGPLGRFHHVVDHGLVVDTGAWRLQRPEVGFEVLQELVLVPPSGVLPRLARNSTLAASAYGCIEAYSVLPASSPYRSCSSAASIASGLRAKVSAAVWSHPDSVATVMSSAGPAGADALIVEIVPPPPPPPPLLPDDPAMGENSTPLWFQRHRFWPGTRVDPAGQ